MSEHFNVQPDLERADQAASARVDLTCKEKWFVLRQLGISSWMHRTKPTSGAIASLSFAVTSIAATALFVPLGLTHHALAAALLVAISIGVFGWIFSRREGGKVSDWKRSAALGSLGAPVLIVVAMNVASPRAKTSAPVDMTTVQSGGNSRSACHAAGQSLASVYLGNAVQLAKADLMPSEVMNAGCARAAEGSYDPQGCVDACRKGFASVVKEAIR